MLASIYWWHTLNYIFLLIPLITSFDKKNRFTSPIIFFFMAFYCVALEYRYKTIKNELLGFHSTLLVSIEDIQHNELKDTYRLTGSVTLKESNKTARIQIFSKKHPLLKAGDSAEFKNLKFENIKNPEYEKYLLKENIHGITYCSSLVVTLLAQKKSITHYIRQRFLQLEKKTSIMLSKNSYVLFSSLFLGSKKYSESLDLSIKDFFNRWGINHFLARSGLHVTLILFFIMFLGRLFLVPFRYLTLVTCFFMILYSLISYSSVSFLRAFIMSLLSLLCLVKRVPVNSLHLLTITSAILLIYNPFLSLFLDFQLTFLLTWGLCILTLLDF